METAGKNNFFRRSHSNPQKKEQDASSFDNTTKNPYFAEVIEASLQIWTAQCWRWNQGVDFANLIVVNEPKRAIFGLVYAIETGSWQAGRTLIAYQKTEAELLGEQPQIFEFLRTNFSCLTLGYKELTPPFISSEALGDVPEYEVQAPIFYQYAPQPPQIHSFVRLATDAEIALFFADNRYISSLFAGDQYYNLEELLLGLIQFRIQKGLFDLDQWDKFIDSFALLTGNDYRRLKVFLHRLQPLLASLS